jgi:hypothetical protein
MSKSAYLLKEIIILFTLCEIINMFVFKSTILLCHFLFLHSFTLFLLTYFCLLPE